MKNKGEFKNRKIDGFGNMQQININLGYACAEKVNEAKNQFIVGRLMPDWKPTPCIIKEEPTFKYNNGDVLTPKQLSEYYAKHKKIRVILAPK